MRNCLFNSTITNIVSITRLANWYAWAENYWELDTVENSMLAVREVIDIYTDEVRRQTELRILAEESNNEEAAKEAQGHIETLHKKSTAYGHLSGKNMFGSWRETAEAA